MNGRSLRHRSDGAPHTLRPGRPEEAGFSSTRLENAFQVVGRYVEEGRIPGAVVTVGRYGRVIGPRAFGMASLEPEKRPAESLTVYDIASVTKVVATATAILILMERGEVCLDDAVKDYVPGVPDGIAIRHLLTHTSGLPAYLQSIPPEADRDWVLKSILDTALINAPGQAFVYSCLGFILLGEIVERVSGLPLSRFCIRHIFSPLMMHDTRFTPSRDMAKRSAPTEYDARGEMLRGVVHDEAARAMGGVSGNAGLFSTAEDLGIFCQMMLNGGLHGGVRVLSEASIRLATRDHNAHLGPEARCGLGWRLQPPVGSPVGDLLSPSAYGHLGFTGTSIWIDPDRALFAVLLTNRVHPNRENQAHLRLRKAFHNALVAAAVS